ncbi:MAG TPA: branched-chain amino acid ABC transporter substrate-binding protein [Syntrophales bacterium]|nr:branched-chain amino acid ABC transporter substrate-binding protein [Syntrophales bacterium]
MKSRLESILLASIMAIVCLNLMTPVSVQAAETIKLGVAVPLSGDIASYGIPSARAAELVAKDINSKGGILGRKVEVLAEDDVCKPEVATNAATKLVTKGAIVVVGHICSGATKAALGIYKEGHVIAMSPSATNTELTLSGKYPNFYRTIGYDKNQAKLAVDFALKNLNLNKIAILHDKGDYGKGFAEETKKNIEESKKATVVLFEGITQGAVDYSAVVQKIKQSRADAVIYGGYHPEAASIVTQMRKKGLKTLLISDDGVKDNTFIKVAGKYAEGVYATSHKDTSKNPLAIAAIEAHKKTYGSEPGAFYLNGYAAAEALLYAIKNAGSTDYEKIRKALRTYYVDTPLGKIKFDSKGDAIGVGFSVYQVRNGVYVEVK